MEIRSETPRDYAAITAINVRAFDNRTTEALIVTLHRHRAAFDPELSLVADDRGTLVGHVLFSPRTVRLCGEDVQVVNLAPLAVDPTMQRKGVGTQLIKAGHALAREKGYVLSFLLGHATYYQRYAFGSSSLSVRRPMEPVEELVTRGPTQDDLPALQQLWRHEEGAVDFAIDPGPNLIDWLSPHPAIESLVWIRGDALVGYTRIHHTAGQVQPRVFLAADASAALAMAAAIGPKDGAAAASALELPLHPQSASAHVLGVAEAKAWGAAMVCPLLPSQYETYYARTQAGELPAGRPIWPVEFDL
jgi:putative acetyltransferase